MVFDAQRFLEGLYRPGAIDEPQDANVGTTASSPNPALVVTSADLPAAWHELWDERAAIMEYDGGLPREVAEAQALADIVDRMQQANGGCHG